jgi:hypothetical protein
MRRAKQPYVEIFWVVAGKPKLTLGNKATRAGVCSPESPVRASVAQNW